MLALPIHTGPGFLISLAPNATRSSLVQSISAPFNCAVLPAKGDIANHDLDLEVSSDMLQTEAATCVALQSAECAAMTRFDHTPLPFHGSPDLSSRFLTPSLLPAKFQMDSLKTLVLYCPCVSTAGDLAEASGKGNLQASPCSRSFNGRLAFPKRFC